MAIKKYDYELSIWDEALSENGQKIEKKKAIIGAHDMDYLGRATNIKLNRDIKGTNTLTFDMPQKYFDSKIGQYVKNEFIDELYNEKKVKLNFNGQWFEFYIKSISERKEFKSIIKSFTCQDSFIDELSRTGYEITFDEELYNNVDEISPFMEVILEDSIWDYRPDLNIGDFTEFTEERFYKIPLKQFGGKISAYPIKLKVTPESLKEESAYYKKVKEKNKNFDLNSERNKEVILKNIYTNKERQLELGDDLSYRKEIFWDAHRTDNGFALLDEKEKVTLMGDYIYVAYSDLSFIYGSIYEDPYKSTEEPALYGTYDQNLGYALQPSSKDPSSLIQFIYFHDNDEVFIDESGTIVNNDCHYVITIEEWNNILKGVYQKRGNNTDKGLIYWKTEFIDNGKITEKYETASANNVIYTKNVIPVDSTIDDFTWYPVYHEDYLSEINEQEVFAARKISITNRTEFNLKSEYYTTIYSNNAEEYINLYSEKEKDNENDELNFLKENDFRVQSKEETRIITPTLARNLITNGTNITTTNGWERLTQNDQTEYNTGSYSNLLEINVKTTTQNEHFYEATGETVDEGISDYYLEILSPNIEKCDNLSAEGDTSKDYALNFGLTELENGIEKDKIYAIRICTGNWEIIDYNILFRKDFKINEKEDSEEKTNKEELSNIRKQCTEEDAKKYKEALKTYNQALYNNRIIFQGKELTIDSDVNDFKKLIDSWVQAHDAEKKDFEKWSNVVIVDNDYKYLINRLYIELQKEQEKQKELDKKEETKKEEDKKEENEEEEKDEISVNIPEIYSESLKEDSYESWISSCIFENKIFNKSYNQDLDKVIIGQGSIDINGNYEMDGVQNKESDKFITFSDIFERIETNINNSTLDFVGYEKNKVSAKETKSLLVNTLYHNKNNNKWSWTNKTIDKGINVIDNAFLLFKAKANISSPYVGILSESEPMTIKVEDLNIKSYAETDMSGVKIEARAKVTSENKETVNYLVDKVKYTIYILDDDNFSSDFLNRVGVLNDNENNNSDSASTDKYNLKDGDLLANAEPLWTGVSSSTLPTFFRNITENPNGTGTNKYALFVNDLYYGILWLDKKGAKQKEGDK